MWLQVAAVDDSRDDEPPLLGHLQVSNCADFDAIQDAPVPGPLAPDVSFTI